jgi:hypothetical protein
MLYAGIYFGGMVLGFFVSAFTFGKDRLWDDHDDKSIPVIITFFWPAAISLVIVYYTTYVINTIICTIGKSPKLFFWLLNKTVNGIDYVRNYKSNPLNTSRKRIAVPNPSIKQDYRAPGAHPCIACGTHTSLDQSNMECIELNIDTAEERSFRMEFDI